MPLIGIQNCSVLMAFIRKNMVVSLCIVGAKLNLISKLNILKLIDKLIQNRTYDISKRFLVLKTHVYNKVY